MRGLDFSLYLLANIVFFVDLFDILVRLYLRHEQALPRHGERVSGTSVPLDIGEFTTYEARLHLRPYAILASVYNAEQELPQFLERMDPFYDRLWVIDDGSTDGTWEMLEHHGTHRVRSPRNQQKPAAIRLLLASLPREIETVIVIDPDCGLLTRRAEFERLLFEFQRSGSAALCPHLRIRHDGWLTRFQQLEYALAFSLGRKSLGNVSITSGVAVYRRASLERVLDQHTLSVYAEDLENTLRLLLHDEHIYYDGRIVVETDGKRTVSGLFSQRVGWYYGLLKVYLQHWRRIINRIDIGFVFGYQFVVYTGILAVLLHPAKLAGVVLLVLSAVNGLDNLCGGLLIADTSLTNPVYFISFYLKYLVLIILLIPLAVSRGTRMRVLAIAPFYPLYPIAVLVPATLGYVNWVTLRLLGRRVYVDHYQPAAS
jgi:cellulose synthase/poly-beta-1,6-N-acetylglucosamine synthase-like glycosyltransferase